MLSIVFYFCDNILNTSRNLLVISRSTDPISHSTIFRPTRHRLKTCPSSKITAKSPGSLPAMNNRKKLKGIYCTASGKWTSQIHHQGKLLYLGLFASEREAAVVYDKACLYLRGRDAELNFKLSDYLNARGEIIEDPSIRLCLATHGIYRWAHLCMCGVCTFYPSMRSAYQL